MRFKSRTRALVGGAAAGLLALSGLATLAPAADAAVPAKSGVTRIEGGTRFETNAEGLKVLCGYDPATLKCTINIEDVTIVNGLAFPDALAAAALGQPIVMVLPDSVPQAILDALALLDTAPGAVAGTTFDVAGGTAAVSNTAVGQLVGAGHTLDKRFAGTNRIGTAISLGAGTGSTVFLVNSLNWADALVVSPVAYANGAAVLLTATSSLSDGVFDFLLDNGIANVVIVGGTAAVSQDIEDELSAWFNVTRVGGATRYETAQLFNDRLIEGDDFGSDVFTSPAGSTVGDQIGLASGQSPFDALAGGPVVGDEGGLVQLVPPTGFNGPADTLFGEHPPGWAPLFGGDAALQPQVETDATAATASAGDTGLVWDTTTTAIKFDKADGTTITFDETAAGLTFTVDGAASNLAGFQAAVTNGDTITKNGTAVALTNGSAVSGMVGQVDQASSSFAIVTPGNNIITDFPSTAGATAWMVDGNASTAAEFFNNANVGDTVVVSDGADGGTVPDDVFSLTNATLTGLVTGSANPGPPFMIGMLGDNPDSAANDSTFVPDGVSQSFTVDGNAALFSTFNAQVDDGDTVSYSRTGNATSGTEVFALTNKAASPTGDNSFTAWTQVQAADDAPGAEVLDLFGGGKVFTFGDAGSGATIVADDPLSVFLDGAITTIDGVEKALLPGAEDIAPFGHVVKFTDGASADTLEVSRLAETPVLPVAPNTVTNNNTNDDSADVTLNGNPIATALTFVELGSDATSVAKFFVNGTEVLYPVFEDHLDQMDATVPPDATANNPGGDRLQVKVSKTITEYHLTSNETP